MCDITDKEFEKIYLPFYNNVNDYLNKYSILELSFNKIKGIINQEFDYQMIAYYNLMEDYNYRIDKFDFREKKIYFKNVY